MRSLFVMVLVVVCACSKPKPDEAVVKYVNSDMAESIARAKEASAVFAELRATDYDKPGLMKDMIRAATSLRVARQKAGTIQPPAPMTTRHADFLSMTGEIKRVLDALIVARGLGDQSKFESAHVQLMSVGQSWYSWNEKLARDLKEQHVTFVPATNLAALPEEPAPAPPEPAVAKAPPPPCKAGTEVKKEDALIECDLEKETDSVPSCAPGHATFDPTTGEISGCITQSMWALPYETQRPKEHVVVCGPGAYTRDKDGNTTACTLRSDVTVGTTVIAKGSYVTIGDKLAVTSATLAGTKTCFDGAGAAVGCAP
ncbi:MAG: hypothetical protein H0T46_34660 [Deltaproteobacteria bacterium]|nr:hypothetical protein [Deltaproteobacteria bacterium]